MSIIPRIDVESASREKLITHIEELEWILSDALPSTSEREIYRSRFNLSPQQAIILAALAKGRVCEPDYLISIASQWKEDISYEQIKVQLHRVRKRLNPFGIRIRNIFGTGYVIDPDHLHQLRSLFSEGAPA